MKGLAAGVLIAQRYRLSAPLGAGAQGSVWEAVDTRRAASLCAIKFANEAVQQRSEVEILLTLEHPSLPRAIDYGTHVDGTFLVLERVIGTPLDSGMDARTVIRALADVAAALAVLHDAGLVHGDVKPANVLVGSDRAWLVDLGLAAKHGAGAPSGTLAFMPPEALAGERGPANDLYALGVTAALTLTGMHPLVDDPSNRNALLHAIAQRTAPRDRVIAALPPACRDAVAMLLSADPERRALSARGWLGRLARDAATELSPAQRNAALAFAHERTARVPLSGRENERESAHRGLERALSGSGSGVVVVGPAGAGRRRLADDAIRGILIEWAARGELPEVVDELPAEPVRPTIVRRMDATPDQVRAVTGAIERLARFTDGQPAIALIATCAEPLSVASLTEVSLGPLDRASLGTLLELVAGRALAEPALNAWLDVTGGLPGRAVTLADSLESAAVATATRDDLERHAAPSVTVPVPAELGTDAREVVLVLAAAGEALAPREIAGVLALTSAAGRVAEIVRRALAIERDGSVRLVSPIGLDALAASERIRLGNALENWFATNEPTRWAIRTRAAVLRGDRNAARVHADSAARAPGVGPLGRVPWLEIAAHNADDPAPFLLRVGGELVIAGEPRRALEILATLPATADVLALRTDALRRAGSMDAARTLALELEQHPDAAARVVARITLARDAVDHGDPASALTKLGALADGEEMPDSLRARALEVGALAALTAGDTAKAMSRLERAEQLCLASGDTVQRARLRSLHGMACQQRGAHEAGLRAYREAWALANEAGDAHGAATYAVNIGAAELECGGLGEAAHWIARGARALARLGRMGDLGRALANLASLHAFIGDRAGAVDHASHAEQAARDAGDRITEALARLVAAEVSLDGAAAGEALMEAAEASTRGGDDALAGDANARAAIAFARAGELDRARAALDSAASAPAPLRALAAAEIALTARESASELAMRRDAVRDALAEERTLEHELHALALTVGVAELLGEPQEVRRARAAHAARVEALASTLPEALSQIFRDAHVLPAERAPNPGSAHTSISARSPGTDARWRRLAEITREMNSEHRLRPLLERVMDAIIELTGAARGFLLLKAPDGVLHIRTARNIGKRDLAGEEMAMSRSVAERVMSNGEPLITIDATSDRRLDAFESVHAMRMRSILAVPLVVQGEPVGTVYVDDRFRVAAFGDDALEIAREFAEAAAVAIHNARTQALLRRAAHKSDRLSRELKKQVDAQTVELEATRLALAPTTRGRYDAIIGRGTAMLRTLALVDKVAPTAMPVLVLGESGTGKELLARAIHANSPRATRPFVAENCGAIPETLLESVLFGHVKGAFTGADRTRAGLFEVADGGTLFLDEIGEMSPGMQAKLLRVLQDGEVRPLGGERSKRVDVRVVAATHRDLADMVQKGRFREDLFYRLAVMVIPIPPLRSRREDLPPLISHFIEKHARRTMGVERKAMARLVGFAWPGNVRQLENEIMRACVLADGVIREEDLSPALLAAQSAPADTVVRDPLDLRKAVETLERSMIERALREHTGNQSRAAKALGLSRFGLQKKLKRLAAGEPVAADDDADDDNGEDSQTKIRLVKV